MGNALIETSPTNPLSLYAETKLSSERALLESELDLEPVILRFATLCGPSKRMRFDLVLNIMTAVACINGEITVLGGPQWRPLLDVRDAAEAISLLLQKDAAEVSNSIINVGANHLNTTIEELADLVAETVDGTRINRVPTETDSRSYKVNFDRIKKLGYETNIPLKESIMDVANHIHDMEISDIRNPIYNNSMWNYETDVMHLAEG